MRHREGIRFADVEHPEGFHIDTVNGVLPGNGEVKIADGEPGGLVNDIVLKQKKNTLIF